MKQFLNDANVFPQFSYDDKEYLLTGFYFYDQLLLHNGMMLHSSAVVVDERAYLFSGNCGAGKSTHTQLWLQLFGKDAYIINDDKPALKYENGCWFVYGTPWSGKEDVSKNTKARLKSIAFVEQGKENSIIPLNGIEAIKAVFQQTSRPSAKIYRAKILELLDKLISNIPIWKLTCNTDLSAAVLSYETMSGKKYKGE